jgi:hypothetical protein
MPDEQKSLNPAPNIIEMTRREHYEYYVFDNAAKITMRDSKGVLKEIVAKFLEYIDIAKSQGVLFTRETTDAELHQLGLKREIEKKRSSIDPFYYSEEVLFNEKKYFKSWVLMPQAMTTLFNIQPPTRVF